MQKLHEVFAGFAAKTSKTSKTSIPKKPLRPENFQAVWMIGQAAASWPATWPRGLFAAMQKR